jgi:hypothetical protein
MSRITLGLGLNLIRNSIVSISGAVPATNYILAENNDRFLTEDGINLLIKE